VIGIGAGQQSRIHCTRLAADKADNWYVTHSMVMIFTICGLFCNISVPVKSESNRVITGATMFATRLF